MKQTIKLFIKRFNSVIPFVMVAIIGVIISGVFEHFHNGEDFCNSNAILLGEIGSYEARYYFIGFYGLINSMAAMTFVVGSFVIALIAAYKNEYKYSYNLGCTKGNNVLANVMLGLVLGLIIFIAVIITFLISVLVYRGKYEYSMSGMFSANVLTWALTFFVIFTAMYSIALLLIKLSQRNKLLFILGLAMFILLYCCLVIIPINRLELNNAYYKFICTWKGQISVASLGAILGYGGYVLLSYKMEVRR